MEERVCNWDCNSKVVVRKFLILEGCCDYSQCQSMLVSEDKLHPPLPRAQNKKSSMVGRVSEQCTLRSVFSAVCADISSFLVYEL